MSFKIAELPEKNYQFLFICITKRKWMGSPCKCHRKGCSLSLGFTAQLHILYFSKPISINLSGIDLAVKKPERTTTKINTLLLEHMRIKWHILTIDIFTTYIYMCVCGLGLSIAKGIFFYH